MDEKILKEINIICLKNGVTYDEIKSYSRADNVRLARILVIVKLREAFDFSFKDISKILDKSAANISEHYNKYLKTLEFCNLKNIDFKEAHNNFQYSDIEMFLFQKKLKENESK